MSVLVEGGGEILGQALDQRLIDKVQIYIGAQFNGGGVFAFGGKGGGTTAESLRLDLPRYRRIGNDIRVTGYPKAVT
jgi:diaminohydroxyphosphoribosylaminopyrimidine deaminase/5-amino-6-(5-phosphoribosylamino)uracil reductase